MSQRAKQKIKCTRILDNTVEGENRKVITYAEYYSECPLVGIWTLPPPLSPASVPFPPEARGGGHTRLRVRGGGVPIPTTGA